MSKIRVFLLAIGVLSGTLMSAQCADELGMYDHFRLELETDTIDYHVYAPHGIEAVSTALIFIQGSGADPLFQIEPTEEGLFMMSSVPFSEASLPPDYALVLVSKRGLPFCTKTDQEFSVPKSFYKNESLSNRASRVSAVIDHLTSTTIGRPVKIVALGHSEGSDVVAKLGTINDQISSIGFWSGGGNTQLYDFVIFIRKEVQAGQISEEEGVRQLDALFEQYDDIIAKPHSIEDYWQGHSYQRWSGFSEAPIENLLKVEVPIFVAVGTADQSVPVESAYLIPVEFRRFGKTNLTFTAYPGLDHFFGEPTGNGDYVDHLDEVFGAFIQWVESLD